MCASAKELLAPARELAGRTARAHERKNRPRPYAEGGTTPPHRPRVAHGDAVKLSGKSCCAAILGATGRNMERELWPCLVRWVGASETTNRGVSSDHRSPTLLPYCSTTAD